MSGAVAALRWDAEYHRMEITKRTPLTRERQMIAILHTELVHSTAMALLALTLMLNPLIARFVPARRRR